MTTNICILTMVGGQQHVIIPSDDPDITFRNTSKGLGHEWVKKYTVFKMSKVIPNVPRKCVNELINNVVIEYMIKYGYNNVRGGYIQMMC